MSRIYLANKLFNVHDRLASLDLCEAVDSWVDNGELALTEHCFLPYRDSNNELPPGDDLGQLIFDLDVENMQNSKAIAGYYEGPVYDCGMGFEIGYMWTLGSPAVMITTDYYKQTIGDSDKFVEISDYLSYIGKIVQVSLPDDDIVDYREQCMNIRDKAWAEFKTTLADALISGNNFDPALLDEAEIYDFYLDPNFKYNESGREIMSKIIDEINLLGKTYIIGNNQDNIGNTIEDDILNLAKSKKQIFYVEEFDSDLDSAIIQGIAYGLNKDPIMFSTKQKQLQNGDYLFSKNPMVLYSARKQLATSFEQLLTFIRA